MAEEKVKCTLAPMTRRQSQTTPAGRRPDDMASAISMDVSGLLILPKPPPIPSFMASAPALELRQLLPWLIAAALIYLLLVLLGPVLTPFVAAAIIGYVLNPGVDWLCTRGVPRSPAVMIVLVSLVLTITAVVLILMPILTAQIPVLEQRLPALLDAFDRAVRPALKQLGLSVHLDSTALKALLAQKLAGAEGLSASMLTWVRVGGSAMLGWVATLFLMPIVLFYLLLDWHQIFARIAETVPRRLIDLVMEMAREADSLLAQYLRGQLLVMLLLATYYSAALAIAGFEVALPVGMITGLLVFIPYVGFGLGLTLALVSAVLFFEGWYGLIAVAFIYGFGQFIESFYLTPRLVGERIGLHPLTVIFALLAFGQLFGFVGVLLALPASAILSVVYGRVRQHYLTSSFYRQS